MRELEGRSYKEIAELLGLSTSALETLLFRARRSLAEELENLVTCQSAELALSRQSDGRLSRKDRKRLDAHVAECPSCARFSRSQAWQRKAFKGLAVLPVPVGIALFRDAPLAAAGTVTAIGEAGVTTAGGSATTAGASVGAGAAGGGATGGSITVGGTVAGTTLLGGAAVKVAAVVAAASVAVGVGYQGVKAFGVDTPSHPAAASASTKGARATAAAGLAATAAAPKLGRVATSAAGSETTNVPSSARKGVVPIDSDTEDAAARNDGVATGGDAGPDAGASSQGSGASAPTSPGTGETRRHRTGAERACRCVAQ